jgi:hypothetical protein
MGKETTANPKWMPMAMRKSWIRDWLCPAFAYISLLLFWQPSSFLGWIMLLPFYALSGAALSTYWDWLFKYDNYYAHGFGTGLAGFCLIVFVPWWILVLRLVICTVGMGLWSAKEDVDWKEEMGRGVFFIL